MASSVGGNKETATGKPIGLEVGSEASIWPSANSSVLASSNRKSVGSLVVVGSALTEGSSVGDAVGVSDVVGDSDGDSDGDAVGAPVGDEEGS